MRILNVIHAWYPEGRGGTEAHARAVAQVLTARGHQIGVFARTGRPDRPEYEVSTSWDGKISLSRVNNNYLQTPSLPWVYKNEDIHRAFIREVEEFQPDLVHIHHLTGLSTTIIEAAKSRGLPVVMTLHDFWTVCPRGQRMTRDLDLCEQVDRRRCSTCLSGLWPHLFNPESKDPVIVDGRGQLAPLSLAEWDRHMAYVLDLCDLLIAPSEFHRERMLDFPLPADRFVSLPHGMDAAEFKDIPARSADRPVRSIGFIGSVIPVKGVHVLLESFRALVTKYPNLRLDIHGEMPPFHDDQDYGQRLREHARGLDSIKFHGAYQPEDVPKILESIDILVVPSLWWETFCLTIREGLLAGVPVIASDLGAMREALDGELDGLFFRPGDSGDLREKLELLIEDEALRERLHARAFAVKGMDTYAGELEALYDQATKSAAERKTSLVIAPPYFPETLPEPEVALAEIDRSNPTWDQIQVRLSQEGSAGVSVSTQMPDANSPHLDVGLEIRDGGRELGRVNLEVDLAALAHAIGIQGDHPGEAELAQSEPQPDPVTAQAKSPKGKASVPQQDGPDPKGQAQPHSRLAGSDGAKGVVRQKVATSKPRVRKQSIQRGDVKLQKWTIERPKSAEDR